MKQKLTFLCIRLLQIPFDALIYALVYYLVVLPITDQIHLDLPLLHYKYFFLFAIGIAMYSKPKIRLQINRRKMWRDALRAYIVPIICCIIVIVVHFFCHI